MRILGSAHSGTMGYMVRGDSPVKSIYDIGPDTRVARCPLGAEMIYALLAWRGMYENGGPDDFSSHTWNVQWVPVASWEENLTAIIDGTADVGWATPENPLVREAASTAPGIRFLDLPADSDPEGAKRFRKFLPFGQLLPAPEHGVKEIWGRTSLVGTACLVCRDGLDEQLAYSLTKWFDENYELYRDKGNKLATYTREAFRWTLDVAMTPVHPGAAAYFREIGIWTPADDARHDYNSRLMTWYCGAWDAAVARAGQEGIEISASNENWVRFWADWKKQAGIPGYRQMDDGDIQEGLALLERRNR